MHDQMRLFQNLAILTIGLKCTPQRYALIVMQIVMCLILNQQPSLMHYQRSIMRYRNTLAVKNLFAVALS